MSTNFYWVPGPTDALSTFSKIYIGKWSGGWSFSFKGYRFSQDEPVSVDVGQGLTMLVDVVQLTLVATSWDEWKGYVSRSGTVEDEYERTLTFAEFVEVVEVDTAPTATFNGRPLLNHVTMLRTDPRYSGEAQFRDEQQYWLDNKGYSFSLGEFS